MNLKSKLLLLLIVCFPLFVEGSQEESEQLYVRLATDNQLLPMYLTQFVDDNSNMDKSYIKKLHDVLDFDLNNNGMTYTLPRTSEKEKLANKSSLEGTGKDWHAQHVYYVVKTHINKDKQLSALLLSVNSGSIKSVESLPLTGDLNQDRKRIHKLADVIYKNLFGTEGIASTHILFTVRNKIGDTKWSSEVWESDYDGENARVVVKEDGYTLHPTYLVPKPGFISSSFFYVAYKSSQPKIFVSKLKDGTGKRLTSLRGNQLMPAVSRQRDQVAFISDVTGNPDLFLQKFNPETGAVGKPRQIFSGKKATQGTPTFSPDGKKIAFVSNKDGSPKIYVIDIPTEGTPLKDIKAQLITRHCKEGSAPSWSPDGKKIAYCAMTNGTRQIWIYDYATKEERQISQGPGNKENPSWAPNSLSLVYNCSEGGSCDLYLISINQPKGTKITSGIGEKRFPNWEPRAYAAADIE
jgi:TolB protein